MVQDARRLMGVPPGVDIRAVSEEEVRHIEVSVDDRKGERCVEHLLRRGRAPLEVPPRARVVVGIVPSSPNAIRDPLLPPAVLQASATKRSRTSVSVAPSHFALASAVVSPRSPGLEYVK